ncbi:unnamed protein product [Protopolystoma xenopodis]|uniref:Uncharacterized protein n=1 Tax=Protopolystoma xenopodis TaxID=117903 RepID=A0A448WX87_9PLAT|nr:unnamed protein product [Protopolystoma xenopodis]
MLMPSDTAMSFLIDLNSDGNLANSGHIAFFLIEQSIMALDLIRGWINHINTVPGLLDAAQALLLLGVHPSGLALDQQDAILSSVSLATEAGRGRMCDVTTTTLGKRRERPIGEFFHNHRSRHHVSIAIHVDFSPKMHTHPDWNWRQF